MDEINLDQVAEDAAKAVLASQAADAEAKAEKDADLAEMQELAEKAAEEKYKAVYDEKLESMKYGKIGFPSIKKVTKPGNDEAEQMRVMDHWLRTGDERAIRASMQEGTGAEGGFVVPEDWYTSIIEKRDAMSFPRRAGVSVLGTSVDVVKIAAEDAKQSAFAVVAEEGAYGQSEPTIAQVSITIHKFGKVSKVSEELLEDEQTDLVSYLGNGFARSMALTEASQVATGTGSSQLQGLTVGGDSDAVTFDSGIDSIASTDIQALYYGLSEGYLNGGGSVGWLMHRNSLAKIRQITISNNWAWPQRDMDLINPGNGQPVESLFGLPVWTQEDVGQASDDGQFMMLGDFNFYQLVERSGLVISRNPFLYQANGQVGFFAHYRQGGAVLLKEAFAWGNSA
jgi:HK97 family phage major capsid protein